jgi:hypothetical protein
VFLYEIGNEEMKTHTNSCAGYSQRKYHFADLGEEKRIKRKAYTGRCEDADWMGLA